VQKRRRNKLALQFMTLIYSLKDHKRSEFMILSKKQLAAGVALLPIVFFLRG